VKVSGGGFTRKAEAVRHGIARALVIHGAGDEERKTRLKKQILEARRTCKKNARKFGLKKARSLLNEQTVKKLPREFFLFCCHTFPTLSVSM